MRLSLLTTIFLGVITSLVAGDACVVGGPADEVTAAEYCCGRAHGTWYQFFDVQAICVMDSARTPGYSYCVDHIAGYPGLDTTCIPGDGGLSSSAAATSSIVPQQTIT